MTRTIGLLLLLVMGSATCAAAEDAGSEVYTVRIYDIGALTVPETEYPLGIGVPGNRAEQRTPPQTSAVSVGGTSAGGVGGGMFSVPSAAVSLSSVSDVTEANGYASLSPDRSDRAEIQRLVSLLTSMVAPASWADPEPGEGGGRCRAMGTSLVIRQTAGVHAEIQQFLDDLRQAIAGQGIPLHLKAWWLPVAGDQSVRLAEILAAESDVEALDGFCDDVHGFRAELACQCNRVSHTTSGVRRSYVSTSVPSVGTGASGYSAIVDLTNLGLSLEARPIEVVNSNGGDDSCDLMYTLQLRSTLSLPEKEGIQLRDQPWEIDRVMVGVHRIETNCRVCVGQPSIAGRLSVPAEQSWLEDDDVVLEVVHVVLLTTE